MCRSFHFTLDPALSLLLECALIWSYYLTLLPKTGVIQFLVPTLLRSASSGGL
jgi:hypothetical protein